MDGFKNGFSIKYEGPDQRWDRSPNHKLKCGTKTILWNKLMKEVKLKRAVGPMKQIEDYYSTYIQSPVTLVPKGKDGKDCRLVFNLSYSFGNNPSVNDCTRTEEKTVHYQDLSHAIELILREEDGKNQIYLGKFDAASAFRQIPLARTETKWLIMKAEHPETGEVYYFGDRVLSFGHGISCRVYQDFAVAVGHIFTYRTGNPINSYLDDVLIIGLFRERCKDLMIEYQHLCQLIGLPLLPEKTEGPVTIIVFLGTLLNTLQRTIGIPQEKIDRAMAELSFVIENKKVTVHYLQKLTGLLNFLCRAIIPGKAFTRHMYNKFSSTTLKQHHHVRVDREFVN